MEFFTRLLSEPLYVILLALTLFTGVLVVLLFCALERDKELGKRLYDVEETLSDRFDSTRRADAERDRKSREELSGNLRGMGDSVSRLVSDMERTQSERMDEFAGQLRQLMNAVDKRVARLDAALTSEGARESDGRENDVKRFGELSRRVEAAASALESSATALLNLNDERLLAARDEDGKRFSALSRRIDAAASALEAGTAQLQSDNYERLLAARDEDDKRFNALSRRIDAAVSALESSAAELASDDERRFEAISERVDSTLERRLGDRFDSVSQRLDEICRGLDEMRALAGGIGDLKRALTSVRARGASGEVQLGALMRQLLSPEQYLENAELKRGRARAACAVYMPERGGATLLLPIDAGAPQEAYMALQDARDAGDARLDEFAERLRAELTERANFISSEFISQPATTPYAVMFLPFEGMYAEALGINGLAERLRRDYSVILAGPATLAALLNGVRIGCKTLALEKRSGEVWELLNQVRGEYGDFADALARTQKRLRQATESIDEAARRSRTLQKRLKAARTPDGALEAPEEDSNEYGDWN